MDQWCSAFEWFQTGRNYAGSGQSALALGSYEEALRQFEKVADNFPGYETKMVNYRLKALRREIENMKSEATPEDIAIAAEYITFINLMEKADDERFSSRRAKALETFRQAKAGLAAIVSRKPEVYQTAVKAQQDRLDESITWLGKLVTGAERKPLPLQWPAPVTGRLIKGTTEFVKESDLPTSPGQMVSAGLFPGNS